MATTLEQLEKEGQFLNLWSNIPTVL